MTKFQHRHYEAIADVFAATRPADHAQLDAWQNIRDHLAAMFKTDNAKFKEGRFADACNREA